jgi:hypothetical protein
MANKKISGSCLCGALRFETDAVPLFQGFCQCTDCRKVGSGHYAAIGLPRDAVKISGKSTKFGKQGESGKTIYRNFCPTCGGMVFDLMDVMPEVIIVNGALLDDASLFKPESVIYTRSAVAWDHVDPKLPKFEGMPQTG